MHPMLNIAVRAARGAGNVIARAFENTDKLEVNAKGTNDFVTNVDLQAEQIIIDALQYSYPDHSIVSEECGSIVGKNPDYQWIIDPIDGTANFVKGIPHFAVSICLKVKGKLDQAVIYDPIRGDLFTASRGNGAQLNNVRVRVKSHKELSGTILATGFPHKQKASTEAYMGMFQDLFLKTADIRSAGCPSLDLAYVAAGRVDGFWQLGLKPWNTSGGLVTDFVGGHNHPKSGNIVAASPRLLKDMLKEMRPHLTPAMKTL